MKSDRDATCVKSDVCDMAVCDGAECKHRFMVALAQAAASKSGALNDGVCQMCGAPVDESGMYPGSAHVG